MRVGFLLLSLILSACGGGSLSGSSSPPMDFSVSTTPANSALSSPFTPFMGHTKVMVGFSGSNTSGDSAPFDMQYAYLNSGIFSTYDHAKCLNGTVSTKLCSWWGAWQEDIPARGLYATRFINTAKARNWNAVPRPQIPFFTYYMVLPASGLKEGVAETYALDDQTFLTAYFDDWRFLLQKIDKEQAMLHIEPDLFGYLKARAVAATGQPSDIPAKVSQSNPTDCGTGYTNDAAGYAQCMSTWCASMRPTPRWACIYHLGPIPVRVMLHRGPASCSPWALIRATFWWQIPPTAMPTGTASC